MHARLLAAPRGLTGEDGLARAHITRAYLATLSTLREQITALEALVIASFVRGLSTRDVEAALVDALGERASVSRSTVSRICEQIKTDFEANKYRGPGRAGRRGGRPAGRSSGCTRPRPPAPRPSGCGALPLC